MFYRRRPWNHQIGWVPGLIYVDHFVDSNQIVKECKRYRESTCQGIAWTRPQPIFSRNRFVQGQKRARERERLPQWPPPGILNLNLVEIKFDCLEQNIKFSEYLLLVQNREVPCQWIETKSQHSWLTPSDQGSIKTNRGRDWRPQPDCRWSNRLCCGVWTVWTGWTILDSFFWRGHAFYEVLPRTACENACLLL